MEYIHYGSKEFNINKFQEIENHRCFNKPIGGLWASAINAKFGWKQWCDRNDLFDCDDVWSFKFKLSDNSNIYYINTVSDAENLPQIFIEFKLKRQVYPDFKQIKQNGIDAIQFNLSNDYDLYFTLLGWDCDSILILNKDIIKL